MDEFGSAHLNFGVEVWDNCHHRNNALEAYLLSIYITIVVVIISRCVAIMVFQRLSFGLAVNFVQ